MRPTNTCAWRAGMVAIFIVFTATPCAVAADILFPDPLHIVRSVDDPLANSTVEVEEYFSGNRAISIRGGRSTMVDYQAREVVEIDRAAGTYSVSTFGGIESARESVRRRSPGRAGAQSNSIPGAWSIRPSGVRASRAGRSADWFVMESPAGGSRLEVGVDREITVSREALDVLTGGASAGEGEQNEAVARACRRTGPESHEARYGLPLEQVVTIDGDTGAVAFRCSVIRVDHELPTADLMSIPAGARLVPSRRTLLPRALRELDSGKAPSRP